VAGLALAGCAITENWARTGSSKEDLAVDSFECRKSVDESGNLGSAQSTTDPYDRCMIAHGWSKR
jgi:hypothetical protein